MQINGNIQVFCKDQLIAKGQNLITNSGKTIFLDWLSHNSYENASLYSQNRNGKIYSGASLSSQRFVPNLTFTLQNGSQSTDSLNMFQIADNAIDISDSTLYITLSQLTNICGMYINAKGSNTTWQYTNQVKIYYSTETVAQSNGKWKLVKIVLNSYMDSRQQSASKMIRFDNIDTTDGYVSAKSFKLQFIGRANNVIKLRGIGLLQKIPYPNVPCAIGLGNGIAQPLLTDTSLTNQICKLFVNKQLCNYQKTTETQESSTTQFVKIDLSHKMPSIEELNGVNKINVVYVSRINYNQYNNIQFSEIGLFYPSNQADYQRGALSCDKMFSHGLFQQPWSKNNSQIIDIKYTISITV